MAVTERDTTGHEPLMLEGMHQLEVTLASPHDPHGTAKWCLELSPIFGTIRDSLLQDIATFRDLPNPNATTAEGVTWREVEHLASQLKEELHRLSHDAYEEGRQLQIAFSPEKSDSAYERLIAKGQAILASLSQYAAHRRQLETS